MKPFFGGLTKSRKNDSPTLNGVNKTFYLNRFAPLMDEKNRAPQENTENILELLREVLENASQRILVLEEALEILTKKRLNMKQFELLSKIKQDEGLLYYQLINKLSQRQGLPESTVRWNLNKLRDAGMVVTGDKNIKGVPVRLTEKGKIVASAFKNGKKR